MAAMKSSIKIAFLAALPIEALNFWIAPFPIDVGYPPDTPWYLNLRGAFAEIEDLSNLGPVELVDCIRGL
jgi:hypothetical protein